MSETNEVRCDRSYREHCGRRDGKCETHWPTRETMTRLANRGTAARNADYKRVYAATRDHRAAIRAYCAGNKWLEENAKAVGNW